MSCAWPQGDPRDPDFSFCGLPVARPGLAYCAEHAARAYRKDPTRPRLRKSTPRSKQAPGARPAASNTKAAGRSYGEWQGLGCEVGE
jgi:hypothetical protein